MAAKLISRRSFKQPGRLNVQELFFDVPHDYTKPEGQRIRVFARSVQRSALQPADDKSQQLPWMVFLQGGPGFGCSLPRDIAWLNPVLDRGYQVLLPDYRGVGLSSPVTADTLAVHGDAAKQAEYLTKFRADNIVRDCEAIRQCLTAELPEKDRKWSIIGQSFGGFCCTTYLSMFPAGLKEVFITGGIPPLVNEPSEVYAQTYKKVVERNEAYYQKYPEDIRNVRKICQHLDKVKPKVGSGYLDARRFQQLGITFGGHAGFDRVHDIVLRSVNDLEVFGFMTRPTLQLIDSFGELDVAIIYAVLHEAIYCQGEASKWTADRLRSEDSQFTIEGNDSAIYFTGEMIYKDMFETYDELKALKDVAEELATRKDWPKLYDEAQLANNEVPVYASVYVEDMYVDYKLVMETAKKIKGLKTYITNVWYHGAIRDHAEPLMQALFKLKDDVLD